MENQNPGLVYCILTRFLQWQLNCIKEDKKLIIKLFDFYDFIPLKRAQNLAFSNYFQQIIFMNTVNRLNFLFILCT